MQDGLILYRAGLCCGAVVLIDERVSFVLSSGRIPVG